MIKKILLSLSLALLFSNIFFIDVSNVLIGDGGDNYEFFGFMHLARENMLSGKMPFSHTNTLRYPNGFNFNYGFDGIAPVFTGAVLGMIISPILSYNFTVVLILFTNIFCSIYFFEKGQIFRKRSYFFSNFMQYLWFYTGFYLFIKNFFRRHFIFFILVNKKFPDF